jgi:hypothetical protein
MPSLYSRNPKLSNVKDTNNPGKLNFIAACLARVGDTLLESWPLALLASQTHIFRAG